MANGIKLNEAQEAAVVFPHDKPAIVTAAAGSGKTTLLVRRVIRLLSDKELDIPADRIAIMTFTRNATQSMRQKLNEALAEELEELADKSSQEDRERCDYLKKQMFALRGAAISTIDAFCLRMIKENAEMFELPVSFSIADSAKKAAIQSQAMKAALQELYGGGDTFSDKERDALFFSFGFEDDRELERAVLSLHDKLICFPDPDKWLEQAADSYKDLASVEKRYLPLLDGFLETAVTRGIAQTQKYADEDILAGLDRQVGTSKKEEERNNVLGVISDIIEFDRYRFEALKNDYEAYKKAPSAAKLGELLKNFKDNSKDEPKLNSNTWRNFSYKKRFNAISKQISATAEKLLDFEIDPETEENAVGDIHTAVCAFVKLVKVFGEYYELEKKNAGCIDFSDCERELYNKLSENGGDNGFRRQLSERFRCIIVDEFQDSNNIQAEIFRLLGEGRLFYVGDVKQSIYSFRGADPYIMARLCDEAESGFTKLPLNTNYRSRKAVIDTVNAAFEGLMTKEFGGVDYADNNGLNPGLTLPEPQIKELYDAEICMLYGVTAKNDSEEFETDMKMPRFVARRIKELRENEDFLIADGSDDSGAPKYRRAEYSDFLILLRTNTKLAGYRKALAELDIASAAPRGKNFLEADEVLMVYNYLKVIDNPMLNAETLKVMMSPIYRFTAEEISRIRMGILGIEDLNDTELKEIADTYKRRSLYSCACGCLTNTARKGKEKIAVTRAISPKLQRFIGDLKAFRYFMGSGSLDDLVRKIYEDTDLISVVASFEDSAGRVANIRRVQRLAADFEGRGGGNLGDFVRFLDRAKENSKRGVEEAERAESSANAVRIMTFHGSKGLEAPVCILAELQGTMNTSDHTAKMLACYEHGLALTHTDIRNRRRTKPISYRALSRFIRDRQLGDELRLMYVAMTRAREKLIMVTNCTKENFTKFDKITDSAADPELHDDIYDSSCVFRCVMSTLLQRNAAVNGTEKVLKFSDIDCRISAYDVTDTDTESSGTAEKRVSEDIAPKSDISPELSARAEEIAKLIHQSYTHPEDTIQQAKFTTTELAHKKSAKPISLTKPSFASDTKISGVEKGNAYHRCMENFPLDKLSPDWELAEMTPRVGGILDNMCENRRITEKERGIVNDESIAKFFTNELGRRMLRAYAKNPDNVKREQSFYAEVNGREVMQDYDGSISIQGQTDMYFIEDGEIVVVDYKSDTIENLAKERKSYELQVKIYMKILGKLTGKNVKEMYLYAFLADRELKI